MVVYFIYCLRNTRSDQLVRHVNSGESFVCNRGPQLRLNSDQPASRFQFYQITSFYFYWHLCTRYAHMHMRIWTFMYTPTRFRRASLRTFGNYTQADAIISRVWLSRSSLKKIYMKIIVKEKSLQLYSRRALDQRSSKKRLRHSSRSMWVGIKSASRNEDCDARYKKVCGS